MSIVHAILCNEFHLYINNTSHVLIELKMLCITLGLHNVNVCAQLKVNS